MGSFGERLQRERELRGISLEEISEATKIGTRSLKALEDQDFDQLPGGIFNKGFVRAYARYLGLDEEQAVADYLVALSEAIAAGKVVRQESTVNNTTPERNLPLGNLEDSEPFRLPVGLIAVVVILAAAIFGGGKYYTKSGLPNLRHVRAASSQPPPQPKANPVTPAAMPSVPPMATPAPAAPMLQPAAAASTVQPVFKPAAAQDKDGFVVRLKAKQSSWVSLTVDDKPAVEENLPAGAEKSIRAQRSVVLKVGDASALELFHNDKLVPSLGATGQVKTVEFTSAGLRQ